MTHFLQPCLTKHPRASQNSTADWEASSQNMSLWKLFQIANSYCKMVSCCGYYCLGLLVIEPTTSVSVQESLLVFFLL